MNIDVTPEEINKYFAEQIIGSALGKIFKKRLDIELNNLTSSYGNPIDKLVNELVLNVLREAVYDDEEMREKIRESIREKITKEVLDQIVDKAWDVITDKIGRL